MQETWVPMVGYNPNIPQFISRWNNQPIDPNSPLIHPLPSQRDIQGRQVAIEKTQARRWAQNLDICIRCWKKSLKSPKKVGN